MVFFGPWHDFWQNCPNIFWVLDLWPDTLVALKVLKSEWQIKLFKILINWIYSNCDIVLAQSKSILKEIKNSLKRGDRVEFRGFGTWASNIQKARLSRNPRTGEKVSTPEKRTINFKMSKDLFKKINNEEE